MLEEQLERARKDTVALKRKLDSRPPAPLNPALLRAAQVPLPSSPRPLKIPMLGYDFKTYWTIEH